MAVAEQVRLATVEEHVRGENARDRDAVMRTFSDSDQASVVYNGIPATGHTPRFGGPMRLDSTLCRTSASK